MLTLVIRHRQGLPVVGLRDDFSLLSAESRVAFLGLGTRIEELYELDEARGVCRYREAQLTVAPLKRESLEQLIGPRNLDAWIGAWKTRLRNALTTTPEHLRPIPVPVNSPG